MSEQVFLGWSSTKQGIMRLAQGLNAVMPVGLEPATHLSWVKHSTTVLPTAYFDQQLYLLLSWKYNS